MSNYKQIPEGKDPELWEQAKNRVEFKSHFITYLAVNAFLWALWYFTGNRNGGHGNFVPWPLWATLGWGLGLVLHFARAYIFPRSNTIEGEYEKLRNQSTKKQ